MLFNDDPAPGHAVLQHGACESSDLAERDLRLLPAPRPPRDDRPAGRHERSSASARATRSGLSFATDDLITPATQGQASSPTPRSRCMKFKKLYERGIITEQERYNQVLDAWTHAREQITAEMMAGAGERLSATDGYVNPVYLMAHSGARGGVEQIRQLGRHARSDGQAVRRDHRDADQGELPRRPDGARVLQLARTAPARVWPIRPSRRPTRATSPASWPTWPRTSSSRMHDCGTTQGITKGVIYRGEKVEVTPGRRDPRPRQPPEHRQPDHRRDDRQRERADHRRDRPQDRGAGPGEDPGPQPDDLRRLARRLPLLLRHGPVDRLAGRRRHGRRHHRRPVASASRARSSRCVRSTSAASASTSVEESEIKAKKAGIVKFTRLQGRDQRRRPERSCSPATAKSRCSTPRAASWRSTRFPPAPSCSSTRTRRSRPAQVALRVGPAQHPDSRRSRRQGPLRGRRRRRNDAPREGPQRPHAPT